MKRTYRLRSLLYTVTVGILFLLPSQTARAQFGVIDVANLGESIYQFIENNFQHAENMLEMGKQLQTALENLENTKQTLQTMKKTFTIAKKYFDAAGVLVDVYDLCEEVYYDATNAYTKIQRMASTGEISPTQVYLTARVIKEGVSDISDLTSYLKNEVFNEENQMTTEERMQETRQKIKEAKATVQTIKFTVHALDYQIGKDNRAIGQKAMDAFGVQRAETSEAMAQAQAEMEEQIKDSLRDGGSSSSPTGKYSRKALAMKALDISAYAITLLAILFFGWNFGVYNHGDRQRSDVLWKAGAGYLVMLIVIQIVKVAIIGVIIK